MPDIFRFLQRGRALVLALLASMLAFSALAQSDPPGRIGRIAWLSGDVFLNNPDTGELNAAPVNQPLTSGDIIATGSGARAEIQIGAMTLRLDSGSRISFDRIDDEQVRVFVDTGRIIAKLPTEDTRRDFVLETSQGRFTPRNTGIYRFDSDGDNNGANATAYFGTLRFEGRDMAFDINAGESARVRTNNAGQLRYEMAQGVRDEFTQWSAARDQRQRASESPRYVSPEMTGAQDLDAHGDWSENPEYGAVWFPRAVAADWAPYRTGHWAWVAPWGWTWIGHESWGFAPFHYGRWVRVHGAWAWAPGTRIARPTYAPALVGWVGTPGGGVSVSIGSAPTVGWFPLAPREVYVPFYRSSHQHVRVVNAPHVPHIRDIDEIVTRPQDAVRHTPFVHRDEPHALSVAPSDTFRHQSPTVRIEPKPGNIREFRDRSVHVAPPAAPPQLQPQRAPETEVRPRPPQRPFPEPQVQRTQPNQPINISPRIERPEPQTQSQTIRQPQQPRPVSPELRVQEPSFRHEAPQRELREAPVRQMPQPARSEPPKPAVQQITPPVSREMPHDRPREAARPPEPRHEIRVEPRQERIQSPHPGPREQRDDRRERSNRPGPGEQERR